MKRGIIAALLSLLALFAVSCVAAEPDTSPEASPTASQDAAQTGTVTVTFDYVHLGGVASNQFAVWIEDADGNHVRTLYATRFTARGGFRDRPESIPDWVAAFGLADRTADEIDAVTGATPRTGELCYVWDCTDEDGVPVADGTYRYVAEGSLRWEMRVKYTGEIEVGGTDASSVAEAEFFGDDGEDRVMITNVTAEYMP